jgi:hypothetical protein
LNLDFESWLRQGIENNWCGPAVCYTHDGLPTSEPEDAEFEEGSDPCLHIIRLYEDDDHKSAIEAAHSPSTWRASNRGIDV